MALEFWIRNNVAAEVEVVDLGIFLDPSVIIDLYTLVDQYQVNRSAAKGDLFTLEAANTVDFLTDGTGTTTRTPLETPVEYLSPDERALIGTGGGGGITESQHRDLDQLVHLLAEDSFMEPTYDVNGIMTRIDVYTDGTKTTKVRDITWTKSGCFIATVSVVQYDAAGVSEETLNYTINRDANNRVTNVDIVRTP